MIINSKRILTVYPESFFANIYSINPFRMVGLIDVSIEYYYGIERVTLAFYRSSGTNNGKIQGLWYPIVGIKTQTGLFIEFTEYINFVLSRTTKDSFAKKGWLAKSLFFYSYFPDPTKEIGFSSGMHYQSLLGIGENLRELYKKNSFHAIPSLNAQILNGIITSTNIYLGNKHTQRENFEKFIQDIFNQV